MSCKKILIAVITALFLIVALTACDSAEEPGISFIDWNNHDLRAEQFVVALLNGDFSTAAEGFDEEMRHALSVSELRKAWRDTVRVAGEFVSIERAEVVPHEDYEIYNVITRHATRDINTRIVFSFDGKVAGLFFSFI